jgi:hypothetical protein
MYSLDKSLIELTERLGYQFVKEYKGHYYLKTDKYQEVFPLNFELIDKTMEMLLRILEQSFITATQNLIITFCIFLRIL